MVVGSMKGTMGLGWGAMEFRDHNRLPNHKFYSKRFHAFSRVGGPSSERPDTIRDPAGREIFSAQTFSTLPTSPPPQPIAHRYFCSFFEDKALVALADGGQGGMPAVEAAERALVGFLDYMHNIRNSLETTREAAHALQRAFSRAHKYIVDGKNETKVCGTTQLLGGLLLRLHGEEDRWAFICCSVGHCKALCVKKSDGMIIDVTEDNYLYRVQTPLGRLGPCVESSFPDLTNMRLYYLPCGPGDRIVLATQGAYANFHPQQQGKPPSQLRLSISDWKELKNSTEGRSGLNEFLTKEIQPTLAAPTVQKMLTQFTDRVMALSESTREAMKAGTSAERLSEEGHHALLDHATVFAFEVATLQTMTVDREQEIPVAPLISAGRQWYWHAFIPKTENCFDLFTFLEERNPNMKAILEACKEQPVSESYINLADGGLELRQESALVLQVRVRSKTSPLNLEKWEAAGEINLETAKPKSKTALGSSLSILLRQKEVDRRKVTEAAQALVHLETAKDVFVVVGSKREVSLGDFGSAWKIISGDMVITQSDITITTAGGESRGEHRLLVLASKKENSIINFAKHLPRQEDWICASMAEFLVSSGPHEEVIEDK